MPYNDFQNESATELIERLHTIYHNYCSACLTQLQAARVPKLFKGWFASYDASAEPLNQEFLNNVEAVLSQLAQELEKLNADERHSYAVKAIELVMAPKPSQGKKPYEWYLMIAEYYSDVILPYLASDDLRRIRDEFLKRTPKNMMFPKQRELCRKMDEALAAK